MSNIKYVIRQRHFFYNDEGQYLTDPEFDGCEGYGEIDKIEESLKLAQHYCDQKNIQFMRQARLYEYSPPCENHTHNAPSKKYQAELDQLLQQYGHHLCDQEGNLIEYLPTDLPDQAVLEFTKKVNILAYEVMEFQQEEQLFAIWLCREHKYFGYKHILTYTHPDAFSLLGTYIFDNEVFIDGSLQDLSDTPDLLKNFIEHNAGYFEYRINPTGIFIESADVIDFSDLLALNALLKQPLFEIRQVTLEELTQL